MKKKARKYTPVVQVLRPTPVELCETYAQLGKLDKILELRADSLALLLARSNVRAGARVLVVDTGIGLVTGALAQRMAGLGSLLVAHARPHVPLDGVHMLNTPPDGWAAISAAPLDDVRTALEDMAASGAHVSAPRAFDSVAAAPAGAAATAEGAPAVAAAATLVRSAGRSFRRLSPAETAQWLADGCDSLVIAMSATTPELVRTLVRALRPSGSVAVYNACMQPLAQLTHELARDGSPVMNAQMCESWAREYQVLPNRTHPMMTNVLPTGYVLSGFARPRADVRA
mgnify:FL=1